MSSTLLAGPAQLRGCAVGATTGALAVAAHGAAGGGYPSSAGAALLLVTTLLTGWFSASLAPTARTRIASAGTGVLLPLSTGQFVGHWVSTGLAGHHTAAGAPPGDPEPAAMFTAHLLAVLLCAVTIATAERLYRAVSAVVRVLLTSVRDDHPTFRPPVATNVAAWSTLAPNGGAGPRAPPARVRTDVPTSFGEKVFRPCPTGSPHPCGAA